jgi:hypothetical protein
MATADQDAKLIEDLAGYLQFHLGLSFEGAIAIIRASRPQADNSEILSLLSAGAGRFDFDAYLLARTPAQGVA